MALLVRAWLLVAAVRLVLWVLPWRGVVRMIGAGRGVPALDAAVSGRTPRASVAQLARAVQLASRVVPRATCLTQTLALARLLTAEGYASRVHLGVRKSPRFAAHAWVEHEGASLLDTAEGIASYTRLASWDAARPDLMR